jgi:SAM-dependent methyltransferase
MEAKFQRRIQRYGWDRAVGSYEPGWQAQLTPAHDLMLKMMPLQPGERVLDVACGTGLVSLRLAAGVGEQGCVVGTDISERMVEAASNIAGKQDIRNVQFCRHDAEALPFPDASFDAAVCALGLKYVPDPVRALREMRRLVKSDGRVAIAVWGARQRCGWAAVFLITDTRVAPLRGWAPRGKRLVASFHHPGMRNPGTACRKRPISSALSTSGSLSGLWPPTKRSNASVLPRVIP